MAAKFWSKSGRKGRKPVGKAGGQWLERPDKAGKQTGGRDAARGRRWKATGMTAGTSLTKWLDG